jgi:hypothetical protein
MGLRIVVGVLLVALVGGIGILVYASTLSPPTQTYEQIVPVTGG